MPTGVRSPRRPGTVDRSIKQIKGSLRPYALFVCVGRRRRHALPTPGALLHVGVVGLGLGAVVPVTLGLRRRRIRIAALDIGRWFGRHGGTLRIVVIGGRVIVTGVIPPRVTPAGVAPARITPVSRTDERETETYARVAVITPVRAPVITPLRAPIVNSVRTPMRVPVIGPVRTPLRTPAGTPLRASLRAPLGQGGSTCSHRQQSDGKHRERPNPVHDRFPFAHDHKGKTTREHKRFR